MADWWRGLLERRKADGSFHHSPEDTHALLLAAALHLLAQPIPVPLPDFVLLLLGEAAHAAGLAGDESAQVVKDDLRALSRPLPPHLDQEWNYLLRALDVAVAAAGTHAGPQHAPP